jgi:polysaccharide export outer membrane protein
LGSSFIIVMRGSFGIALIITTIGLAASAFPQTRSTQPPPRRGSQTGDYKIGAGDVLRILTWKEADFSGSFPVRFDGKITIPFVGDIDVAGRTPTELKGELEENIGRFVDVARVSVAIEKPNSARFFVLGKVSQQGAFPYDGPLRVAQALALAGGFQEFAKLDQIFVIREVNGELIYFPFNYDDFVNRRQLTGNLILLPGDTIVVP